MHILAIDPGAVQSGVVELDLETRRVSRAGVLANRDVPRRFNSNHVKVVAIEDFVTYQAVDRTARETMKWSGVFRWWAEFNSKRVLEITRSEIKAHLCGSCRGMRDTHVWAACCDWYGVGVKDAKGTKAHPGPLYGVTSHARAATAVAMVAYDLFKAADAAEGET